MARLLANEKIQPHWWSKTFAGIILGLTLTYAIVSIFAWYGPGGIEAPSKVQFNMWLITPIWLSIFSLTYLFKTGIKAIVYLSSANILFYSIFLTLRWLS